MYIMDFSDNINGLVDPGQEVWLDDIRRIMQQAKLPNESFIQYRDDDGNVFRLVMKNGDIKQISPKWDI